MLIIVNFKGKKGTKSDLSMPRKTVGLDITDLHNLNALSDHYRIIVEGQRNDQLSVHHNTFQFMVT
jgi:hypothetical protein